MRTIQINYDLLKPGRNYQPVYDYIKSHGVYANPLQSLWLVRTTKTASAIRNELRRLVDRNDKIATFDVTGDAWATNFMDAHVQWMENNMGMISAVRSAA